MILIERLSHLADISRQVLSTRRSEDRRSVSLAADESGTILVFVTIIMLVLCGFLGIVVDLGYGGVKHAMAQTAADAAALGAMQQISTGSTEAAATTAANLLAQDNDFPSSTLTMGYLDSGGSPTANAGSVVTVTASISQTYSTLFLRVIGLNSATVGAQSSAVNGQGTFPCVFCVLSGGASPALNISNNGSVTVTNGAAIVNSNSNGGLTITNNGSLVAQAVGIVGTASISNNGSSSPSPTHITAIADPMAQVALPTLPGSAGGNCDCVSNNGTLSIGPGVHTTISATNNAHLTMTAGTYFITNSLTISNNGTLTANNVLLYFTCGGPVPAYCLNTGQNGAYLDLENNADSIVNAQTGGLYKGLTIIYDRHNTSNLTLGNNGSGNFSGTVYAPMAHIIIQNNGSSLASRIITGTADMSNNGSATIVGTQSLNYVPPGSTNLVR